MALGRGGTPPQEDHTVQVAPRPGHQPAPNCTGKGLRRGSPPRSRPPHPQQGVSRHPRGAGGGVVAPRTGDRERGPGREPGVGHHHHPPGVGGGSEVRKKEDETNEQTNTTKERAV
ncbi:translation initiation factor IF-2-like [Peromyscus californicus insignis]|uniref:translation initiation factor IF-2-like n=1 Tax=Peromyscus californicus insignis TaxID=564181 RepID=UPI0022A7F4A0|nr:translation initiation factor IF-2-like [Peromyscus californicus insignis]